MSYALHPNRRARLLYYPLYIERASDELSFHFYPKPTILLGLFLLVLIETSKAFELYYMLKLFFVASESLEILLQIRQSLYEDGQIF
jgi:hypothetical protein